MTDQPRPAGPAPILIGPPDVFEAPGRGLVPGVSGHLGAVPVLYDLDAQPIETISPLLHRQYLHSSNSTFVKWTAKKGAVVPLHHHRYDQITWFTQGAAEVFSQGKKFMMRAGQVLLIPPNVPHEFVFTEDTIDIDIFSPARQDWMDGTANYYTQS